MIPSPSNQPTSTSRGKTGQKTDQDSHDTVWK
jgi:hypothetical protein